MSYLARAQEVASASPKLEGLRRDIKALAASGKAGRKEQVRARQACVEKCEQAGESCRQKALGLDPACCKAQVEEHCREVYQECRSDPLVKFFGNVSADSECTGRQVACERERMPCGERSGDEGLAGCKHWVETCLGRCPP
jgi:hypothetical protein